MPPRFVLRYLLAIVLCGFMSLGASASSPSADRRVLIGGFVDFPPLTYLNNEGQATGTVIDHINRVAERAGFTVRWQELPVARVHHFLRSGEVDIWPGLSNLSVLKPFTLEAALTLPDITLRAYHLPQTSPVEHADQLQGHRLILIQNYTYHGVLDQALTHPHTIKLVAPNHLSALRMLQMGRGHYLIDYDAPMSATLTRIGMRDLNSSTLALHKVALVVSRQAEDPEGIVNAMNQAEADLTNHKQN
ncbi:MAG: transporter substrate-binding domain-containing protein [Marinobacter sp.]|nr:transporter substrate-binding domain-containing protein [Marinobacter sp.]